MTYNEKKSLYESIMREFAKSVKQILNENSNDYKMFKEIEIGDFLYLTNARTYEITELTVKDIEFVCPPLVTLERVRIEVNEKLPKDSYCDDIYTVSIESWMVLGTKKYAVFTSHKEAENYLKDIKRMKNKKRRL